VKILLSLWREPAMTSPWAPSPSRHCCGEAPSSSVYLGGNPRSMDQMAAAIVRYSPLGGIILGYVCLPGGLVVEFGGVCRVPHGGLSGNYDGDKRWFGCSKIMLVCSCSDVSNFSSF
jgi:hypothetical protein